MNRLLKLKSWQIFGLIIIMPLILMILGAILTKTIGSNAFLGLFGLMAAITMILSYYGWVWGAGIKLLKLDISDNKMSLLLFKSLFITALTLFLIVNPILKATLKDDSIIASRIIGLISFISFLYCIYLVVNSIRNIENYRNFKSTSFFLDFIFIWLLPIGIWTIQPRLSRILSEKIEE